MIIKLLAQQIPLYWEVIKFAATKVENIDEENLHPYLNELLQSLLSNKTQCFVKFDKDKTISRLLITELIFNKIKNEKYLVIRCLYSFVAESDINIWREDWNFVEQLMERKQCAYISFETSNERVCEIGKALGFKERYKSFILK